MTTIERVQLIRHGQTDWNVAGRWQGFEPVPLNPEGYEQARLLADHLRNRPISAIYSSDLPRAFQTASVIGECVGVQPYADPLWREFNLGIFQGFTTDELKVHYAQEWTAFHHDYWNYQIPAGESRRELQDRGYRAWEQMVAAAPGPEVVVLSHGGTIRMLLLRLFPDVESELDKIHITNTSITTIEWNRSGWRLAELAAVPHLPVNSD